MELLEIWYSIPENERIAYVPDIGRIVVKSLQWKHKIQQLLPEWVVCTEYESLLQL